MTSNELPPRPPMPTAAPPTGATPPPPPAATPPPPPTPTAPVSKAPRRTILTILELAALGALGAAALTILSIMLATGIGLAFALGVGLVILVGLVYSLYGVAYVERMRVSELYRLDLDPLPRRRPERPGFGGWLRALLRQSIDGGMWRAIANLAIATVLGGIVLRLVTTAVRMGVLAFSPLTGAETVDGPFGIDVTAGWMPVVAGIAIIACAAAIFGLALLHHSISVAIIGPSRTAELTAQVRTTSAQREGAVRAADLERTRIERDLHDGVQPRLVSVGMTLGLAQQKIDNDPSAAKELIGEAHTSTKAAITELRQLARGIHASVLDDRGLDAALSALAGRSHIPVNLDVRIEQGMTGANARCRDAEAAIYFAVAESLTNAAKHSRASECRVTVRSREGGMLWARVEDNGLGGAQVQPGGGLDGVSNRALAAGGTFRLDSPAGGPTALEVTVPCAS